MKVCPKCGKVIGFNSYFGAYICENCEWEDDTYSRERVEYCTKKKIEIQKEKKEIKMLLATI